MTTDTTDPGQEQSFLTHLIELRQRLVRASVAVLLVFVALTPFMKEIFDLLSQPMMAALPAGSKLLATGVITPFMVPLKVTLFMSFLIALPYVLWQVWAFVAPGLYRHEKKLAAPLIVSSVAMFAAGMAYCYFVVFGFVFKFIAGFAPASVSVSPDIEAGALRLASAGTSRYRELETTVRYLGGERRDLTMSYVWARGTADLGRGRIIATASCK